MHIYNHLQSVNSIGHLRTTNDFVIGFLHFSSFSIALWVLLNSKPVHSLMLSSPFLVFLPCFLPSFIVSCTMVLVRPDEHEYGHTTAVWVIL